MSASGTNTNVQDIQNQPATDQQGQTANSTNSNVDQQYTGLLKDKTFQAIYNAFQLGWSLYELKSRIILASFSIDPALLQTPPANPEPLQTFVEGLWQQAQSIDTSLDLSQTNGSQPTLPEGTSENNWLRSVWRALFKQIADLDRKCALEPDGSYDEMKSSLLHNYPSQDTALQIYPYLDFTCNGITYPKLGMPATIDPEQADLANIVYRALNCLMLLYTDPAKTLIPETIRACQDRLLTEMNITDARDAQKQLSGLIIKLLVTWDNYVREHLYTGGMIKNDGIELAAYEAGRSLASLPWGISVDTVVLENKLSQTTDTVTKQAIEAQLYNAWLTMFQKRNIVHIQHQISIIGQAMDDAYYTITPGAQRPDPQKESRIDDIHLPTRSIEAIRNSLDYWQRSIIWLNKQQPPVLTVELAHALRMALIQQSDVWHSLMMYEQNLSSFTTEAVTLNILNDFMVTLEQAISKRFSRTPLLIGAGILALLFIVIVFVIPLVTQSSMVQSLNQPPAIIVLIGTLLAGGGHAFMSWLDKLRGIFGTSGKAVSDTLQSGYKQLLEEFGDLNYNVAVSGPLLTFFVEDMTSLWQTSTTATPKNEQTGIQIVINDAYSFLTEVVWTDQERKAEIDHIAHAAFGPLGTFIGSQLGTTTPKK